MNEEILKDIDNYLLLREKFKKISIDKFLKYKEFVNSYFHDKYQDKTINQEYYYRKIIEDLHGFKFDDFSKEYVYIEGENRDYNTEVLSMPIYVLYDENWKDKVEEEINKDIADRIKEEFEENEREKERIHKKEKQEYERLAKKFNPNKE